MSRPKASPPASSHRWRPRIKVWFEAEGGYSFGFGLIEILQAVGCSGSIKGAADALGRSYRHVWDRIKEAEHALGCPLVSTQVGGQGTHRSELTDEARQLIADFLAIRHRMIEVLETEFVPRRDPPAR
ncbi:MAG: LysR family transcriptional regulator [Isosphaeraceae bacterium]|nr:LysR family transcriptional regulator [Isosphaeraceae bacterium]